FSHSRQRLKPKSGWILGGHEGARVRHHRPRAAQAARRDPHHMRRTQVRGARIIREPDERAVARPFTLDRYDARECLSFIFLAPNAHTAIAIFGGPRAPTPHPSPLARLLPSPPPPHQNNKHLLLFPPPPVLFPLVFFFSPPPPFFWGPRGGGGPGRFFY